MRARPDVGAAREDMMRTRNVIAGSGLIAAGALLAALVLAFARWDTRAGAVTSDGRAVLRFAAWGAGEETRELRERVVGPVNARAKAEAKGYLVKLEPVPSDYPVKLATMVAGRGAPDIFYLDLSYLAHYAELGALMDLTDLVEADTSAVCDLDDYYPAILGNYFRRGRLYGLPWIAQPVVLYCNAELFEGAGVPLPDRSWRWGEFLDAARRIARHESPDGVERWGFALQPGWPPLEMYVWQMGGEVLAEDGSVALADERTVEAAQFLQDLVHRHRVAPPMDVVLERGISNLFRDGRVAMFAGGAADDLDRTEGLRVVVRELPAGPGGTRATFAWNAGLCISAETRRPALAFEAWKDVLDAIQGWKIAPPRRSLAREIERIEPRKARAAEVIRRSMEYMRPIRVIRERKRWDAELGRLFEQPLIEERRARGSSRAGRRPFSIAFSDNDPTRSQTRPQSGKAVMGGRGPC